jgi:PAS domain S-box-containing protein
LSVGTPSLERDRPASWAEARCPGVTVDVDNTVPVSVERGGQPGAEVSDSMDDQPTILIVDDDTALSKTLADILRIKDYAPVIVSTGEKALRRLESHSPLVAVIDLRLPDIPGLEVLAEIKRRSPGTECIVLTGHASESSAIEAINLGAYSYIRKPYDVEQLLLTIRRAVEKRSAERALRESEEKYRALVQNASEIICAYDLEGNLVSFNPAAARLYGYTHEELASLNIARIVDPEYLPLALHETVAQELLTHSKDGEPIWLEVSTRLVTRDDVPVGVECIARDITARKWAEEGLRGSEERYRTLFERTGNPILVIDTQGNYVDCNEAAMEFLESSRDEILTMNVRDAIPPGREAQIMEQHLPLWDQGGTVETDYRVHGRIKTMELTMTPATWQGKRVVIGLGTDITGRKRAEEELHQSLDYLSRTLEQTVYALAATTEMRDPYTAGHQRRVANLVRAVARELGLPPNQARGVYMAGLVHDVGKLRIPAEILSKPSRLTETEWSLVKTHSQAGYDILKSIEFPWPVAQIVLQHHERLDGSGYPQGLTCEETLPEARILAVADVVEAMASHRPYRPAFPLEEALHEIANHRGTLYAPEPVDACLKVVTERAAELGLK